MVPLHVESEEGSATVELAALLKTFRAQAGLSQQMLADRALDQRPGRQRSRTRLS